MPKNLCQKALPIQLEFSIKANCLKDFALKMNKVRSSFKTERLKQENEIERNI